MGYVLLPLRHLQIIHNMMVIILCNPMEREFLNDICICMCPHLTRASRLFHSAAALLSDSRWILLY